MTELSPQELKLVEDVMNNYGSKFNSRMASHLLNLQDGLVDDGLDGIVSFFARGQHGLEREGLREGRRSPGLYTGNTSYRLLLTYIQQEELYFEGDTQLHPTRSV